MSFYTIDVVWSDDFCPTEIVGKVIECLDPEINKNEIGVLNRFIDTMGYAAPEIKDTRFWGSSNDNHLTWRVNFTSICQNYFLDYKKINAIYNSAVQKYNEVGFIKSKKNMEEQKRAALEEINVADVVI